MSFRVCVFCLGVKAIKLTRDKFGMTEVRRLSLQWVIPLTFEDYRYLHKAVRNWLAFTEANADYHPGLRTTSARLERAA